MISSKGTPTFFMVMIITVILVSSIFLSQEAEAQTTVLKPSKGKLAETQNWMLEGQKGDQKFYLENIQWTSNACPATNQPKVVSGLQFTVTSEWKKVPGGF